MSVISRKSRATHVTSILKPTSLQSRLNESKSTTKVRFQLPFLEKLDNILEDYKSNKNVEDYESLVIALRDSQLTEYDIEMIIKSSLKYIPLLNQKMKLYVEAILSINWTTCNSKVTSEYQSFILNLLSAHNYHTKFAIDKLVEIFIADINEPCWVNGLASEKDVIRFSNIHLIFKNLLEIVPMSRNILLHSLSSQFPYLKKSAHIHEVYVSNLLMVLNYQPKLRPEILGLIFSKLVLLDVNCPREVVHKYESEEEQFQMEDDSNEMKHPIANSLDVCLHQIFTHFYIQSISLSTGDLDWERYKRLYQDMLDIFDKIILPTFNTHHVQFAMFYICGFKTATAEAFLNYLWKKVCNPTVGLILRQTAASYIASFLARASYVTLPMLKGTLQQMSTWIHSYIASQDGSEYVNTDVRIHGVFYSVCQSLFYVVAFRQKDLVNCKKNISFLESLNLGKIVTCKLNPLKACQSAVVQNFAAVTRTYQLAYCYTVMEQNARNILPTIYQDEKGSAFTTNKTLTAYYPFDPYVLKRSNDKILPQYLDYQKPDSPSKVVSMDVTEMEDDDFLADNGSAAMKFSYSASPGFKHTI